MRALQGQNGPIQGRKSGRLTCRRGKPSATRAQHTLANRTNKDRQCQIGKDMEKARCTVAGGTLPGSQMLASRQWTHRYDAALLYFWPCTMVQSTRPHRTLRRVPSGSTNGAWHVTVGRLYAAVPHQRRYQRLHLWWLQASTVTRPPYMNQSHTFDRQRKFATVHSSVRRTGMLDDL